MTPYIGANVLENFTYDIPLTKPSLLAIVWKTNRHKRRFDILVEGLEFIANLDIFGVAGFLIKCNAVAAI